MNELEYMEIKKKEIYDYLNKDKNKRITYQDADKLFSGCKYVFAHMVIDEILEIKEIDDELVYVIVGSDFAGLES